MSVVAVAAVVGVAATVASTAYSMSKGSGGGGQVMDNAQGKKAAEIAADQYNTYVRELKPTETKFINDVMQPTTPLENREAAKVNADIQQKMAASDSAIDPNGSTKAIMDKNKVGEAIANSEIQAGLKVQDKKLAALQAITDIGEGKRTQANTALNTVASDAQKVAIARAQADQDKAGAAIKALGSAAGGVGAVAKNWNWDNSMNMDDMNMNDVPYDYTPNYSSMDTQGFAPLDTGITVPETAIQPLTVV